MFHKYWNVAFIAALWTKIYIDMKKIFECSNVFPPIPVLMGFKPNSSEFNSLVEPISLLDWFQDIMWLQM